MSLQKAILYTFWQSSCAWRVRIALTYKGIDYEDREVDLYKDEHLSEEFVRVNPARHVPVLVHAGRVITESLAILEYLEEAFPDRPKLLSSDLYERALARSLALNIVSAIQPLQNERATSYHSPKDRQAQIAMSNHFMNLGFGALEKRLQSTAGRFSVGDQLSFADACLVPQVYNGVVAYGGVNLDNYPTIKRMFNEVIRASNAFWDSHPYRQPGAPSKLGDEELRSKGFLLENWEMRHGREWVMKEY